MHVAGGNIRIESGDLLLNNGNVLVSNGKLLKQPGGANFMPLCYGRVGSDGAIKSGTNNFTITGNGGYYTIHCPGITEFSTITVTIEGGDGLSGNLYTATCAFSSDGQMLVNTVNLDDYFDHTWTVFTKGSPRQFYFIIYNP